MRYLRGVAVRTRTARLALDVRTRCASFVPAARPGGHPRDRPRRSALRRIPVEGTVGLGLLLARVDGRAHCERPVPANRSVFLHLGRDALDAARVAERATDLPARRRYRLHGRRLRVRPRARDRHGDPRLRPSPAGAAHRGRRGRHVAVRAAGHPVRHAASAGVVLDLLRRPRRRAGPPAPRSRSLVPRASPAVRGVGKRPRAVGRRAGRPGGLYPPVARRSHPDECRSPLGARDGAARDDRDRVHAGGSVAPPLSTALRRCRRLGHGEHQRMAVARLP